MVFPLCLGLFSWCLRLRWPPDHHPSTLGPQGPATPVPEARSAVLYHPLCCSAPPCSKLALCAVHGCSLGPPAPGRLLVFHLRRQGGAEALRLRWPCAFQGSDQCPSSGPRVPRAPSHSSSGGSSGLLAPVRSSKQAAPGLARVSLWGPVRIPSPPPRQHFPLLQNSAQRPLPSSAPSLPGSCNRSLSASRLRLRAPAGLPDSPPGVADTPSPCELS